MKTLFVAINAKYVHTNIAVRYLTHYCRNMGADCDFCELTINEPKDKILEKLYMEDCDMYGFSCYIWNIDRILEICKNLKKLKPACCIFLGGPEVSFDGARILEEYDFIDNIICGEGEMRTAEFLLKKPEGRKVYFGKKVKSLDELPFPYNEEDLKNVAEGEKLVYYETSRGCPFSCSYCLSAADTGVRFLSLERVKAEIKKFSQSGVKTVKFVDRTFNADKKRANEIWDFILGLGGDTCFHFEIGADLLDEEAIEILKKTPEGKIQFEIGVQSTNGRTISEISREMDLDKLFRNVSLLREHTKVMLHIDLIAGLPYENFQSFKKSFNEVYALSPHVLQLGFLKLLKGSPLRRDGEKYQMLYNCFAPYEVFSTGWITYEEIISLKKTEDVLERYFNSRRFDETLKIAVEFFENPFDFYFKLSQFWDSRGLIGQGVKRIKLYGLLFDFLTENLEPEKVRRVVGKMKNDFEKWHSKGEGTPEWYKNYSK